MSRDILLFDLDGTLTDSGPGIMHAAQTALDSFGITGLSEQALRQFVGPPYPGVRECLRALRAAGKRMYVATSKLESMARQVLTHFDLMQYFDGVCGGLYDDPEAGKKVNVVRRALREAGCTDCSRAILSGDREYDIYGGHAAGIQTVGVLYGYGSREELEAAGADALAETPEALLARLL